MCILNNYPLGKDFSHLSNAKYLFFLLNAKHKQTNKQTQQTNNKQTNNFLFYFHSLKLILTKFTPIVPLFWEVHTQTGPRSYTYDPQLFIKSYTECPLFSFSVDVGSLVRHIHATFPDFHIWVSASSQRFPQTCPAPEQKNSTHCLRFLVKMGSCDEIKLSMLRVGLLRYYLSV